MMRASGQRLALFFTALALLSACAIRRAPVARSSGTVTRTPRPSATRTAEPEPEPEAEPEVAEAAPPEVEVAPEPEAIPDEEERSDVPAEPIPATEERADIPSDALEVLTGRASYYADRFHGRPTASGEPYDMHALTAASRDLPFGTVVRVVRVETGASVVVRVNDRGPFRDHARILDLSRAAAEALDMISAGVVDVRAEILERGSGERWHAPE